MSEQEHGAVIMQAMIAKVIDGYAVRHKGDVYEAVLRKLSDEVRLLTFTPTVGTVVGVAGQDIEEGDAIYLAAGGIWLKAAPVNNPKK